MVMAMEWSASKVAVNEIAQGLNSEHGAQSNRLVSSWPAPPLHAARRPMKLAFRADRSCALGIRQADKP